MASARLREAESGAEAGFQFASYATFWNVGFAPQLGRSEQVCRLPKADIAGNDA